MIKFTGTVGFNERRVLAHAPPGSISRDLIRALHLRPVLGVDPLEAGSALVASALSGAQVGRRVCRAVLPVSDVVQVGLGLLQLGRHTLDITFGHGQCNPLLGLW